MVDGLKTLCEAAVELGVQDSVDEANKAFFSECLEDAFRDQKADAHLREVTIALWNDPAIRDVWAKRSQFHLIESLGYYCSRIDEITAPNYIPSMDDVLNCRTKTVGITSMDFVIQNVKFTMFDVGGQRTERRKWMNVFDNVDAVLFLAALSEYDQVLAEDNKTNRMKEALSLFAWVAQQPYFYGVSIILFLNKKDLFANKILDSPIRRVPEFSSFGGRDGSYEDGAEYFKTLFHDRFKGPGGSITSRKLFTHLTCATDTDHIRIIFASCKEAILLESSKALETDGTFT